MESKDGAAWSTVQDSSAHSRAFSGKGDGTYRYRVRAHNAVTGYSAWRTATETVLLPPATAPTLSAPAQAQTRTTYTVSWSAVASASDYKLKTYLNGIAAGTDDEGRARSAQFPAGNLAGITHGYRVEACNAGGCGPWSAKRTVAIVSGGGPCRLSCGGTHVVTGGAAGGTAAPATPSGWRYTLHYVYDCVFHAMAATDFMSWRPPISPHGSHRFHGMTATPPLTG